MAKKEAENNFVQSSFPAVEVDANAPPGCSSMSIGRKPGLTLDPRLRVWGGFSSEAGSFGPLLPPNHSCSLSLRVKEGHVSGSGVKQLFESSA